MNKKSSSQKLAEFRFSIIGNLLSSPPQRGDGIKEFKKLSSKYWKHPLTDNLVKYHWHTIEQWYYDARSDKLHSIDILRPKIRSDKGCSRALTEEVKAIIKERYGEYKSWSYQLHRDNLAIDLKKRGISPIPSYSTVRRYLQSTGKYKIKKNRNHRRDGYKKSKELQEGREIRSYENEYVNGLWHLDFHHSSREVITSAGEIVRPTCLAIIDDHSRLICHIQWYLSESSEDLIHGFNQALQKRGLPRSLMTDNGKAMTSIEFTEGLMRLGITHKLTLPYSPYQNGKQEVLWAQLEGRLMAMLINKKVLLLKELNDLTTAWSEIEYNKSTHSEIHSTPLNRFSNNLDVTRSCPDSIYLNQTFRREESRTIRRSDATISVEGKRFEVPYQYRHFRKIRIRFAKWDLSLIHMVSDEGKIIARIYPLDKSKNSCGARKVVSTEETADIKNDALPPLLEDIVERYRDIGLAPSYLPKDS